MNVKWRNRHFISVAGRLKSHNDLENVVSEASLFKNVKTYTVFLVLVPLHAHLVKC